MKVVAFNGSARHHGNTYDAIKTVLAELEKEGVETEIVQLGKSRVTGCIDCGCCKKPGATQCAITDDMMNDCIAKMIEADGIIIGSPVYFGNVTTEVKALIDRAGRVTRNGFKLSKKVGAAVVVARRAGTNFTYAAINFLFGISGMITAHSTYWNMSLARDEGDYAANDAEAQGTFEKLGQNMAWLLKTTRG